LTQKVPNAFIHLQRLLRIAKYIAICPHETPVVFHNKRAIDMLTIRTTDAIFHVRMAEKLWMKEVVQELRRMEQNQLIFTRRLEYGEKNLKDQLYWSPSNLLDVAIVCKEMGIRSSYSVLAQDVAGEAFCYRSIPKSVGRL
jgi:hypothetical protein